MLQISNLHAETAGKAILKGLSLSINAARCMRSWGRTGGQVDTCLHARWTAGL